MSKLQRLAPILVTASLRCFGSEIAVLRNGFTLRCERREVIGLVTRLYPKIATTDFIDVPSEEIDHFDEDVPLPAIQVTASPRTQSVNDIVNSMSRQYRIDPDLINSVIYAESGFNPRAVSPKGAQGLMQLMPQTAAKLGVPDAFDPGANVEGGTRYLRELLETYDFDLVKALAAYNAGPERVEQYRGVPPYQETRAYIARIVRDFNRKKLAEHKAAATVKANRRAAPPSK
jgi:soluble lytic murein transglycosylase-like protein